MKIQHCAQINVGYSEFSSDIEIDKTIEPELIDNFEKLKKCWMVQKCNFLAYNPKVNKFSQKHHLLGVIGR